MTNSTSKGHTGVLMQQPPRSGHHTDRLPPVEEPLDSYASNRLCLLMDGAQVWLKPWPLRSTTPPVRPLPADIPVESLTYISAWNPDGDRHTLAANRALHADLRSFITSLGHTAIETVAMASRGQWLEQGLAIVDIDEDLAHDLAWKYDQEGWVRIDAAGWHVLPRYESASPRRLDYSVERRDSGRCPMRSFTSPADVCSAVGGPWTSGARTALAAWSAQRRLGIELLGCGICRDGQEAIRAFGRALVLAPDAGVITLREMHVASRFGGWCYGRRIDNEWTDMARTLTAARPIPTTGQDVDETGENEA